MAVNIIAFTKAGGELGAQLKRQFVMDGEECEGFLYDHYMNSDMTAFHDTNEVVRQSFLEKKAVVFISATGIAVRMIAPYIKEKDVDSPVVVLDDCGRYAISLLSGHLGGANRLAAQCARICGAVPVITTATDNHKKFAVDVWAKDNHLIIDDISKIKKISSDVLDGKKVPVWFDKEWISISRLPEELLYDGKLYDEKSFDMQSDNRIIISPYKYISSGIKNETADNILYLIPKQLVVGIGCKKNTPYEKIQKHLKQVFINNNLNIRAVKQICSIDIKAKEEGLLEISRRLDIPLKTFSSKELLDVKGEFTESDFVKATTGVGNVCERSAVAGLENEGKVLIKKNACDGVTIAVAIEKIKLNGKE